ACFRLKLFFIASCALRHPDRTRAEMRPRFDSFHVSGCAPPRGALPCPPLAKLPQRAWGKFSRTAGPHTMISKFMVPQIFLGLFRRKLDVTDYKKLAEALPCRLPGLDGQGQVANEVPKNAPPDAARARFASADQRKVLEVAPAKLQFRMLPGELVPVEGG